MRRYNWMTSCSRHISAQYLRNTRLECSRSLQSTATFSHRCPTVEQLLHLSSLTGTLVRTKPSAHANLGAMPTYCAAFVVSAGSRGRTRTRLNRTRLRCCANSSGGGGERGAKIASAARAAAVRAKARRDLAASHRRLAALRALRQSVDARRRLRVAACAPWLTISFGGISASLYFVYEIFAQARAFLLAKCAAGSATTLLTGPHRLIVAAFVHRSTTHFATNTIALLALGGAVEMLFGASAFGVIYVLGAGLGAVFSAVSRSTTRARIHTVGASGALHALVAALLVHLVCNRTVLGARAADTTATVIATAVAAAMLLAFRAPGVDAAAHVGGFLVGVPAAVALVPQVRRVSNVALIRRSSLRRSLCVFAIGTFIAFTMLAVCVAL